MSKTNPESMGAIPKDMAKTHTNNLPSYQNHDQMNLISLEQQASSVLPDSINVLPRMSSSFQTTYDLKTHDHSQHKAKTKGKVGKPFCEFCKNNNEERSVYMSHVLKDLEGRVVCPVRFTFFYFSSRIEILNP